MPHRLLIEALERLAFLGEVVEKRMFGAYGFYLDGLFFAIFDPKDGRLYLRSDATMSDEREAVGSALLRPGEGEATMPYAWVPPAVLDDARRLAAWADRALRIARLNKEADGSALARMRGLGKASAAMLMDAGIRTPTELRKIGPVAAYRAVEQLGHAPSRNLLWAMEGALTGKMWNRLPAERKAELEAELDAAR
ncbi:MAG: hypothetical protein CMJ94_12750 [Planctomycetes bacterium]|nr:hypothetical protein [Planctomycetota bacterium]